MIGYNAWTHCWRQSWSLSKFPDIESRYLHRYSLEFSQEFKRATVRKFPLSFCLGFEIQISIFWVEGKWLALRQLHLLVGMQWTPQVSSLLFLRLSVVWYRSMRGCVAQLRRQRLGCQCKLGSKLVRREQSYLCESLESAGSDPRHSLTGLFQAY